jgi:hypothetical protein
MKLLEKLILILITVCWVVVIAVIVLIDKGNSWTGIVGLLLFLILYFNANYFIISKLQKFVDSEWDVFKEKIKWANAWAILVFLFLFVLLKSIN